MNGLSVIKKNGFGIADLSVRESISMTVEKRLLR